MRLPVKDAYLRIKILLFTISYSFKTPHFSAKTTTIQLNISRQNTPGLILYLIAQFHLCTPPTQELHPYHVAMNVAPTPVVVEAHLPTSQSVPLPAVQPAPARRANPRTVRLTADQLERAAARAEKLGARAASRPPTDREPRYLAALLNDLARWARATEPALPLAVFAVEAQRAARSKLLRRAIADRRTAAFRRALAHARAPGDAPYDDVAPVAQDEDVEPDDVMRGHAPRVATALDEDIDPDDDTLRASLNAGAKPKPRVAPALDADVDLDDVMPVSAALPKSRVAPALDADIDPADVIDTPSSAVAKPPPRVAAALDMDIDPADAAAAMSSGAPALQSGGGDLDIDHDLEVLLEFEMGG